MTSLTDAEEAALLLRDMLAGLDPDAFDASPAQGCCGCGNWMADVKTAPSAGYPRGEGYCWACVDRMGITGYVVLEGRQR
jgi:hypothetical protein